MAGLALFLYLMLSLPAMAESRFEVHESDVFVSKLVDRWAQADGKKLFWEAPFDFPIDVHKFNKIHKLKTARTFSQAFNRLNNILQAVWPNVAPLIVCEMNNVNKVIEVRSANQPACGEPLAHQGK